MRLLPFGTGIHFAGVPVFKNLPSIHLFESVRSLVLDTVNSKITAALTKCLSFLTILSLSNHNLTSVPPFVLKMKRLNQLVLDNNPHLSSLEAINGHPSLRILIARNCSIERLPSNLPQLTDLHLSSNRLSNLDGIETLGFGNGKEKSFFFDGNRIESVPEQISSVKNLTILNLNDNRLFELPANIVDVPSLRALSIEKNCFYPDVLVDMASELHVTHPKMTFKSKNQRLFANGVCPEK